MLQKIVSSQDKYEIEALLNQILYRIHIEGPIYAEDFESLALIKHFHPEVFNIKETEILYLTGLFYKVNHPSCFVDEVYSIFADAIANETGRRFTPVQADAYKRIHSKRFFSFSAPTSAGKSFLFRELIINANDDIVIVVPSRALIAEYLNVVRDLMSKDNSVLVLQFIDNVNIARTSRRVFIITPERGNELFSYKTIFPIGLFLFDEAQLSEEEIRGLGFDAFVRRVDNVLYYIMNCSYQHISSILWFPNDTSSNVLGQVLVSQYSYFKPYISICEYTNRRLVMRILSSDGATIINKEGSIIYHGAIIKLNAVDQKNSLVGTGESAARLLCSNGCAVKISQDGTIKIFSNNNCKPFVF